MCETVVDDFDITEFFIPGDIIRAEVVRGRRDTWHWKACAF